jgi:ABC-type glycerol-3-phosphate transport system substrate-binding protein
MTLFSRKFLLAGTAALALAACGSDSNGPSVPGVPTGLTVQPVNATTAHVTWSAVSGAAGYSLQRALKSAPTAYTDIGGAISGTSYDDATLTLPITEYAYRVAATNATGTSAWSAAVSFAAGVISGNITANLTRHPHHR